MPQVVKIFGPPGCGKTHRLLGIMERELAGGIAPDRLAYLTFTVAARREAKQRAMVKFGYADEQLRWFRTLHSTAYELLGVNQGALVTAQQGLSAFGERFGYEFSSAGPRYSDEGFPSFGFTTGDKLLAFDHFRRHRELDLETAYRAWPEDRVSFFEASRFTHGYARWKAEDGRLDFTDLLERANTALPCDVVIVDEAQDLSPLQWRALWAFAKDAQRVYLAGDDDQAIYEWAGASAGAFLSQPGAIEVLPQSYRCPGPVTQLAQGIVEGIQEPRQAKEWRPRPGEGRVSSIAELDSLTTVKTGSTLVLYRNHAFANDVLRVLRAEGTPYLQQGKSSLNPEVVRTLLAWEALRHPQRAIHVDDLELIFSYASPQRISAEQRGRAREAKLQSWTRAALGTIADWPDGIFDAPWYNVLDRLREDVFYLRRVIERGGRAALTSTPTVALSTIHGAKGAEADHVVLLTHMSRLVRKSFELAPDAERRVWYVAVTRAKETLTLVGQDNPLF